MDALDTKTKKGKSKRAKKAKKQRAIVMDELMPDGADSSDDDRQQRKRNPDEVNIFLQLCFP